MYKNYEKRVQDFITDMTNPSTQIVITDVTEKVNNCRQELLNESKMQKPFIFKGYTSEQDRINDTVKNNRLLYNLPDYPDTIKKSASKDKIIDKTLRSPIINFHIFEDKKNKRREKEIENELGKNNNENIPIQLTNQALTLDVTRNKDNLDPNRRIFKRRMSTTEKNQIRSLIKKDSILQPQMRFTARTDLERIYDVLNGDYMKNQEREIIERQLKNINLYDYKKPKDLIRLTNKTLKHAQMTQKKNEKSTSVERRNSNDIENLYGPSNIYFEPKNNEKKSWARKDNLNAEAKGLLSSYHFKTHFKATEEIAEYKSKNKRNLKESCFILPHLLPKNHRYQYFNTETDKAIINSISKSVNNKNKKAIDYSKLDDTRRFFKFEEEYEKDILNEKDEESGYNGINNPILKGDKINVNPNSLKILSKLAFSTEIPVKEEKNSNENNESNSNIEKDIEPKKEESAINLSNLNQIAKKVLNECNFYSPKSKFNNSSHKSKEGKTMITKGMTIKEFENKYKFD